MEVKKNPAIDLNRWSPVFFMTGLVVMLSLSWSLIEMESSEGTEGSADTVLVTDNLEEDIPITQQLELPPPPPPPPAMAMQVIEIVEDNIEVEETVIESTELNQDQVIVDIEEIEDVEVEEEVSADVPFAVIEDVPIYPGCESLRSNQERKDCLSSNVSAFVQQKFNNELAGDLGLEGMQKIYVQFKIDKYGDVVNVRARAPHPRLEEEAVEVVRSLPKMIPGKQRGKPVGVIYALPILFKVENVN